LEQALLAAGERVVRVAPKMGASRRGERERGRSDDIDAQAVAHAVVKDGADRFPAAYLDERAMEIRLLFDHREDLVRERTRMQNRLRWHLLELCPELEAKLKRGAISNPCGLERLDRQLRTLAPSVRSRIAREELAHIRALTAQAAQLESELLELVRCHRPRLLDEQGCGTLTAALLIGRTAGAERFRSEACFGRQSGTAPIPCSSGNPTKHRLDHGGDRQLNRALHMLAITRARLDPRDPRVPGALRDRGQDPQGRAALSQAPSRAPRLIPPRRAAARGRTTRERPDAQRRP
jgi:transposase